MKESIHVIGGKATKHATVLGIKVPVLCSQQEVALALGVTQMTVSTLERSAIKKIQKALIGDSKYF